MSHEKHTSQREGQEGDGLNADERAAIKQRAEELRSTRGLKGAARRSRELEAFLEVMESLAGSDATLAAHLHRVVSEEAPELHPKTLYGFPAWADAEGKVVVFFQQAAKWGSRYGTVAFDERARLDDGEMWPTAFALRAWSEDVETYLRRLVARAVRSES